MGAGRGLGRKKPHTFSGSPPTLGSAPMPFQTQGPHTRDLSEAQLGLWDRLSSQCLALLRCIRFYPRACPGRPVLPLIRDDLSCLAPRAALAAPPTPSPCSSATLTSLPPPPTALALPFVVFSFLQTRQATKVLKPTRVPRASPPATTMPSSGTSTRVARSPARCPLVRF